MTGACIECERERNKKWRNQNTEKVRQYAKDYASANPDKLREYRDSRTKISEKWLTTVSEGAMYERWLRLFRSLDRDNAIHYVESSRHAIVLKAAGVAFNLPRLMDEGPAAYRLRLITRITTLPA